MTDKHKTKEQLTQELAGLRQRFAELEASEAQCAQTNEALEAWERKSMALIENSPDIIYILDPDGNFTYLGGNFESLLGFTGEELTGRHFTSIICPEDVKKAEWRFNERRTGKRCTKGFEVRLTTKEGRGKYFELKYLPVELYAIGVYDGHIKAEERKFLGTYGLTRDITKRKRAEEQLMNTGRELQETRDMLVQSEKLAAIGRLTAGVAHEILNPVNIMSMRLQLLKQTKDLPDRTRDVLNICTNQLNRIIEIAKDLGQFSALRKKHITMSDLNEVVGHVLDLCAPQLKEEGIKTDIQYHPELPLIAMDKDRIEQVIFNVLSNATAAMAGLGKKILSVVTNPATSEDYVQVIISDTGPGIDRHHLNRIFDPFFTTKDPAQGTGLGLFISYGIIRDHGGTIWAENDEWGGASFFIELPVDGKANR